MDADLAERWARLTGLLGIDAAEQARVARDLWRRHGEPRRAYHRLSHVRHVLEVIDLLRAEHPPADPVAVQLAAWFHDAVHEPGAADNEERSAILAVDVLTGWRVPEERRDHVAALIRATASHPTEDVDPDTAVLVDGDLAILAADPETYAVYRRAIRVEHGHLAEPAWRKGRAGFLSRMLDRPAIFATDGMRRRGEAAARRNLAEELAALEPPATG